MQNKEKFVLFFGKENTKRIVLFSDQHPTGALIPEHYTEKFVESLLSTKTESYELKDGSLYLYYDNYSFVIEDFEKMEIPAPISLNRKKSSKGKVALAGISLSAIIIFAGIRAVGTDKIIQKSFRAIDKANYYFEKMTEKLGISSDDRIKYEDLTFAPNPELNTEPKETTSTEEVAEEETVPVIPEPFTEVHEITIKERCSVENFYKAQKVYAENKELFDSIASRVGVSPNILLYICMAESSGTHYQSYNQSGDTGLFQINGKTFLNKTLRYFNYETNEFEEITVTNELLKNKETNALVGAVIFRDCLDRLGYNLFAAAQAYNYGYPNLRTHLKKIVGEENSIRILPYEDLSWLEDYCASTWWRCYAYKVISYHDGDSPIIVKMLPDENGVINTIEFNVKNLFLEENVLLKYITSKTK